MANPVHSTKPKSVLVESAKIKDELLEVQTKIEEAAHVIEADLVAQAQQNLGYGTVEGADLDDLVDGRVDDKTTVLSPELLSTVVPVSKRSAQTTRDGRQNIKNILKHKDERLIVVIGPCSIHDTEAALEYAEHVKKWRDEYSNQLEVVMRTYTEKPRSERGWKGFVYDPQLDGSNDINLGLVGTRILICKITDMGVPVAVERLNALTPQYLNGLVAYDVIGSRNTTDQKSREYASATSSPVGFKNPPEGDPKAAPQAIVSASGEHAFLGVGMNGAIKQINTKGNDTGHVILRGSDYGPNYSAEHIDTTRNILHDKGLQESIVVDTSHGNSGKKASQQMGVIDDICSQLGQGETAICGVMVESNLNSGAQKLTNPKDLKYGVSITDECVDIEETAEMLAKLSKAVTLRNSHAKKKKVTTTA